MPAKASHPRTGAARTTRGLTLARPSDSPKRRGDGTPDPFIPGSRKIWPGTGGGFVPPAGSARALHSAVTPDIRLEARSRPDTRDPERIEESWQLELLLTPVHDPQAAGEVLATEGDGTCSLSARPVPPPGVGRQRHLPRGCLGAMLLCQDDEMLVAALLDRGGQPAGNRCSGEWITAPSRLSCGRGFRLCEQQECAPDRANAQPSQRVRKTQCR